MEEKRIFLNPEQAKSILPKGKNVHVFLNPNGMLIGEDWDKKQVLELFESNKDKIEIGGQGCKSMKHGLVVNDGRKLLFIATNEIKLNKLEKSLS